MGRKRLGTEEPSRNRGTGTIAQSMQSALTFWGVIEPWRMGLITRISQLNGIFPSQINRSKHKKDYTLNYEKMKLDIWRYKQGKQDNTGIVEMVKLV